MKSFYIKIWQLLFYIIRFLNIDISITKLAKFLSKSRKTSEIIYSPHPPQLINSNLFRFKLNLKQSFPSSFYDLDKNKPFKWQQEQKFKFSLVFFGIEHACLLHFIEQEFFQNAEIHYLEIGAYERFSALWLSENILNNHKNSSATLITIGGQDTNKILEKNISNSSFKNIKLIFNDSYDQLTKFNSNTFNLIYIDSGHCTQSVIRDAVMAWRTLKVDGILIFDDYLLQNTIKTDLNEFYFPYNAINFFIYTFFREIDIIHVGSIVAIRKKKSAFLVEFPKFGHLLLNFYHKFITDTKKQINIQDDNIFNLLQNEVNKKWSDPFNYTPSEQFLNYLQLNNIKIEECYY